MSTTVARPNPGHRSEPQSWREYWSLPSDLRAEYSGGSTHVSPPPSYRHQEICQRLRDAVRGQLDSVVVAMATGWVNEPGHWARVPDLMLLDRAPEGDNVTDPPLVVVEVLSTNRRVDQGIKAVEYHREGAGQYWIVDPRDEVIDVFFRAPDGWTGGARLSARTPVATISIASHGEVRLDLTELLAP